jgi:hypothetical protein
VTVNNSTTTITSITTSPSTVTEGGQVNLTGHFTDPAILDTHTATVNWGDGTQSTGTVTEPGSSGTGQVTASHYYAETGTYTITLTVTPSHGSAATLTASRGISNANPTVTGAGTQTVILNQPFTLQLATFTDPGFNNPSAPGGGTTETYTPRSTGKTVHP